MSDITPETDKTKTSKEVTQEEETKEVKKPISLTEEDEDKTIYRVLINEEEQYSIWPEYKKNPLGWRDAGKVGKKPDCLNFVKEVWTDMRPLSLRKQMEAAERQKK